MTQEELRDVGNDLAYLLGCAVGGSVPDGRRVGAMDLRRLYALASRHMLAAAAAMALRSAGVQDHDFAQAEARSIRKSVLLEADMSALVARLEAAGIWYAPLKGAILKGLYPAFGMREMADRDVLFDAARADDVREIMGDLGFRAEHFGTSNHDCYYKEPVSNFEMHRALFGPSSSETVCEYYRDVRARLVKDEGNAYGYHFTPEDLYVYLVAHEHKHFAASGTGLRSLLDVFIYLTRVEPDMDYVAAEVRALGIADFEEANRLLSMRLFGGGELTGDDRRMLDYVLSSGTYGTIGHRVENALGDYGGNRLRYALDRFLVPIRPGSRRYEALASTYPLFYRHRALLPLLPLYRTARALRNGRLVAEVRALGRR